MKKSRLGRPKGTKKGSRTRDTKIVSMRFSKKTLEMLDDIRDELSKLSDFEVSRSFMIELLIEGKGDIRRYKRFIRFKG